MHTTGTAFLQIKAVADGTGLGELPCCLADNNPEIERLWPRERPTMRQVWMVIHQDLRRAAKIRLVSNAIAEAFERHAALLRYGRMRRAANTRSQYATKPPLSISFTCTPSISFGAAACASGVIFLT